MKQYEENLAKYEKEMKQYEKDRADYEKANAEYKKTKQGTKPKAPKAPKAPKEPVKPNTEVSSPAKLFAGSWRTFQMSDHLPLWVELKIDFSDQYLKKQKKAE
jgi:endonuclease/exonuclease/phosphatase family metal-dependent hydrolase